jgi:hypothetical protein
LSDDFNNTQQTSSLIDVYQYKSAESAKQIPDMVVAEDQDLGVLHQPGLAEDDVFFNWLHSANGTGII